MPYIPSLDYLDLNSLRRYPLREGVSAISTDTYFSIPDNFIVDFSLSATSDVTRKFFISSIFNKINEVIIEIADSRSPSISVGQFKISVSDHSLNKDYYLEASDDYIGANGKITIGSLDGIISQPSGLFEFTLVSAEFETRTIIPAMTGIDRFHFDDTLYGRRTLTGDVSILARNNTTFSFSQVDSNNKVVLDAGDGLGLNKICDHPVCIKTINGVGPDPETGNINFLGIDCLSVKAGSQQHTLEFSDTCCTPCSGCDELSRLTNRLTSLENKFIEIKNYYTVMNSQLTSYLTTVNSNCSC